MDSVGRLNPEKWCLGILVGVQRRGWRYPWWKTNKQKKKDREDPCIILSRSLGGSAQ